MILKYFVDFELISVYAKINQNSKQFLSDCFFPEQRAQSSCGTGSGV